MRVITSFLFCCLFSFVAAAGVGTVFLESDFVLVPRPDDDIIPTGTWKVLDDRLACVASGEWSATDAHIEIGKLPIGWYRVEFLNREGEVKSFTTAAVLKPLAVAPPQDTPVAVDVALSWVPEKNPQVWEQCVRLARMAGVAMVRDRLRGRDMQPEKDMPLLQDTVYEQTADLQQAHGLQVLQVFHDSPSWAWARPEERGRIPADLRDTWRFCRDIAAHFRGRVQAWQPWNEGNAENFGGHTIDELCSHQKAAYLGFRAGNPEVTVCWTPMGGVNSEALCKGIMDNGTVSYFDVYSMHSYDWCHDYPRLRQYALQAAAGKPFWVTESDRGMHADPDSPHGDLSHENEQRKAAFITQEIVSSLAAGAARHFHFILPQYMEQQNSVQFGLLRYDQTPRIGYVALAAAGRLLAGAQYLGRLPVEEKPDVYLFAFRAQPDGAAQDVLVAWTEGPLDWPERGKATAPLSLPATLTPTAVWDFLGRPLPAAIPEAITSNPVYMLLSKGAVDTLPLDKPVSAASQELEPPSPVVLQLRAPEIPTEARVVNWAHETDRIMSPGDHDLTINTYHFGEGTATGRVSITEIPEGWRCEPSTWEVALEPMDRHEQQLRLHIPEPGAPAEAGAWIKLKGDFGDNGKPCLVFRVMGE